MSTLMLIIGLLALSGTMLFVGFKAGQQHTVAMLADTEDPLTDYHGEQAD